MPSGGAERAPFLDSPFMPGSRTKSRPATLHLRSAAGVELDLEPEAGCVATSLRVNRRERLWLPEARAAFLRHERTGGIPLLFPWANRLRGDRFEILGRRVDLRGAPLVHRDDRGRPMHGVLLRWSDWDSCGVEAGGSAAFAGLDWSAHAALRRILPFRFSLRLSWRLFDGGVSGVEVTTEVLAGDEPVPIAFGWHPYLRLPAARARCALVGTTPVRSMELEDSLPTGRFGGRITDPLPLRSAALDDLVGGVSDGMEMGVAAEDGSRAVVQFVRGYRWAQIFSPRGADFISVEPMTAPTAALGDASTQLPILGPGQRWSAAYRLAFADAARRGGPRR